MGEVVVNGDGGMEFEVQEIGVEAEKAQQAERSNNKKVTVEGGENGAAAVAGASSLVSWGRFLPKMAVSVLLVEADDSTRQIIAALLRKCSYRVAAVPDGLKAWELLKGRPHNIDLILTEVELPSISGDALLTLIMEHEACKNIPVIMMSSNDSVSTVYKCVLRGATDFLVKPVRKNELRNLWQHVWRKQASSTGAGLGPPDESEAQENDEATAENNAVSNHSSGYMSSIKRNKECIEKGSDAQSSCTKPELGTETEDTKHVHHLSMPKSDKCLSNEINIPTQEEYHRQGRQRQAHGDENGESQPLGKMDANYAIPRAAENSHDGCEPVNIVTKNNQVPENSSREAIDLIGAFDNHLKGTFGSSVSNGGATRFNVLPLLDLSLRRSHPSGSANQVNHERHGLNHSDASPFSRYISKSLLLRSSSALPTTCNQQKDREMNSEKQPSNHSLDYNSNTRGPAVSSPKQISVAAVPKEQDKNTFSYPQNGEVSNPIPVRGVRFEDLVNAYGSVVPSIYCAQVGSSPSPSPGTTQHSEPFPLLNAFYPCDSQPLTSQQFNSLVDQRISNSIEQTDNKQGIELEKLEDQGYVSTGNDQSTNGSFCNGDVGRVQSTGSGSKENTNATPPILKAPSEVGNEESFPVHEGYSRQSIQREAALIKFRLKRKDRCFEKKVRYESRKKLAEQRPRVKGQFVRQVPNDPRPGSSSAG